MGKICSLLTSAAIVGGLFPGLAEATTSVTSPPLVAPHSRYVASARADEQTQTFVGRIAQKDGKYVLVEEGKDSMYMLDDQDKAKQFDGQKVKVIVSLDAQTNTIHVSDIQSA